MRSANDCRASRSPNRLRRHELRRLASALAGCGLLTLAAAPSAAAPAGAPQLPSGLSVAAGQAQVTTGGNRMTVTNSPQAILNWNSFSIGSGAAVHFQQATATSQVLNRVTGSDASNILGSLSSNGRVWLLNPNGILFGQGAHVDVAGLVASTLRLSDVDWLAGRWKLGSDLGSTASVVNQGALRTSFGGRVALAGGGVDNAGLVEAPGGQIVLAAGRSVELIDTGAPNLAVRISAPAGEARNLGELRAAGGRIDIHAASVNQQGIVSADALTRGPGGEVWIKASGAIELAAGSRTSADGANGANGGIVHVESDSGRTSVRGSVSAQGTDGAGGQLTLLGSEVGLLDTAHVDASGRSGGGEIRVGGGERGADPRYANARAVYVGPEATLSADATVQGDGGRIVLWSDEATRAFGSFSVQGGLNGGDGGLIETSGGWLDTGPARINTTAPHGRAGRWLLDPYDVTISDFGGDSGYNASYTASGPSATISSGTLISALDAGTDVVVSTGGVRNGGQAGDITLRGAHIVVSASAPGNLTLIADGAITMTTSQIVARRGPQVVTLRSGRGGVGPVTLTDSTIDVSGGAGADVPATETRGITIGGFSSGELPIDVGTFTGAARGFGPPGVTVSNSVLAAGTTGRLAIAGVNAGDAGNQGVVVSDSRLSGYDVDIRGDSSNGNGLRVNRSDIDARHSIFLRGVGQGIGTVVSGNSQLVVDPLRPADMTTGLLVQGRTRGDRGFDGVRINGGDSATLRVRAGAPITVEAGNRSGSGGRLALVETENGSAVINAVGGGRVTLRSNGVEEAASADFGNGLINIAGATIVAGAAGIAIDATGTLTLTDGNITSAGPVALAGYRVDLSGAMISSAATGDAIVIAGHADGGSRQLGRLTYRSVSLPVRNPGGRWIVYATSPTALRPDLDAALDHDFQLHDAAYGDWAAYSGNGLVFGAPITARYRGIVTTRAYDGTVAARVGSASATGQFGNRAVLHVDSPVSYGDPNAGTAKQATFDSPTAFDFVDTDGKPVYGYTLNGSLTGTVTRAGLTGTVTVADKVYDAGTAAQVNVGSLTGLIGSETVQVSATGRFADKNVGSGKDVTANDALADGNNGGLAANYQFFRPLTLTASITPRPVAVSGLVVDSRVYDGTTLAPTTGTATVAPLAGDDLALAGTAAFSFPDRNVGTARPVAISGLQLRGKDANNYVLGSTLTGTVTPRPLFVNGIGVLDKTYDATTAATLSGSPVTAVIAGDQVIVSGTATATARFAEKNVGTAKPVTVTGYTLGGADSGNYAVVQPTDLAATIRPLPVAVSSVIANDKVYDGSTMATLAGIATVATLAGDAVALAGTPAAAFADKNAGNAKPLSVTGFALSGADAANYSLSQPTGLAASITPRRIALAGLTVADKVYDGSTAATLDGTASIAVLAGDAVSPAGKPVANFADANVGAARPVVIGGVTLAGADAGNYRIADGAVGFASIMPATLHYIAEPAVRGVGASLDGFAGQVSGFVDGENEGTATSGKLAFATPAAAGSPAGRYPLLGGGLTAANYRFMQAPDNTSALSIVDFAASVTEVAATKTPRVETLLQRTLPLAIDRSPADSQVLVAVAPAAAPLVSPVAALSEASFAPVALSRLSPGAIRQLLNNRELYMRTALADATTKLEDNPAAADLRECNTAAEARRGTCLLTATLKSRLAGAASDAAQPASAATAPEAATPAAVSADSGSTAGPPLDDAAPPRRRVRSAALPQIDRKIALMIGVDRYADPAIPSLTNAVSDARAVGRVFADKLGYEVVTVTDPTRANVVAALNRLALTLGPRDSVVVYYAGHGDLVEATGLGYWLLADSNAQQPETWLSNADISRSIAQMGARQVALVSDSCYSGSLASEERIRASAGSLDPKTVLDRKSVVVMSSGGNEPVFDEGKDGHSPFAWNLMNTLGQLSNWQAGGNVFERVRFAVARALPQRPQYSASRAAGHESGGDYLFEQRQLEGSGALR